GAQTGAGTNRGGRGLARRQDPGHVTGGNHGWRRATTRRRRLLRAGGQQGRPVGGVLGADMRERACERGTRRDGGQRVVVRRQERFFQRERLIEQRFAWSRYMWLVPCATGRKG